MMRPDSRTQALRGMGIIGLAMALVWFMALQVSLASDRERPKPVAFERDVRPILAANCAGCHGADRPKAGLDLRSVASMMRGGKSGPALSPSDPDGSLLLERIAQGEMPPGKARKLSAGEVATVRAWIRDGARTDHPVTGGPTTASPVRDEDRRFWSFRPLRRPPVPTGIHADRMRTPVDRFLQARLEPKGSDVLPGCGSQHPGAPGVSRPAGPAALPRRRSTPSSRMIGPVPSSGWSIACWPRPITASGGGDTGWTWPDMWIPSDSTPMRPTSSSSEGKWRYRDYVIRAFNEDKPYDRFLTEQLAGDELHDWRKAKRFTPAMREALIATGYLRTARDLTHEDVGVIPQNFFGIVHDTIEIVGTGLLGLTINCARCHSHKFDPIPQEDYYRLMAVFSPAYNPQRLAPGHPDRDEVQGSGIARRLARRAGGDRAAQRRGVDRRLKELARPVE